MDKGKEVRRWLEKALKIQKWIEQIRKQEKRKVYILFSKNSEFRQDESVESLGLSILGRKIELLTKDRKSVYRAQKVQDNIQSSPIQLFDKKNFYMMKSKKEIVFSIHIENEENQEVLIYILSLLKYLMITKVTLLAATTGKEEDIKAINSFLLVKAKEKSSNKDNKDVEIKKHEAHLIEFSNQKKQVKQKQIKETDIKQLLDFFKQKKSPLRQLNRTKDDIVYYLNKLLETGSQIMQKQDYNLQFKQLLEIEKDLQLQQQKMKKSTAEGQSSTFFHPRISYSIFILNICAIQSDCIEKIRKKEPSLQLLKEYLTSIKHQYFKLFSSKNPSLFSNVSDATIFQMQILQNINPNLVSEQLQLLLNKLIPSKISPSQILKNLFLRMLNINIKQKTVDQYEVEKKQSLKYYEQLGRLMTTLYDKHNNQKFVHPLKKLILQAYQRSLQKIRVYKLLSMLDSKQKRLKKAQFEEISIFFQSVKDFNKIEQDMYLEILAKTGKLLKFYGYTEIAIQLFKKLRFENSLKSCIEEIVFLKDSPVQRAKFYFQISEYYQKMSNKEKYIQYCQLAYEEDEKYLEVLLKAKNNTELQKAYAKQLDEFCKKKQKYYSSELPQSVIQRLKKLKDEQFDDQTEELDLISEIPYSQLPLSMRQHF